MARRREGSLPPLKLDDQRSMNEFVAALDRRLRRIEAAAAKGYTTSNVTASRTLNATAATLAELRQFVGTLVEDFVADGLIDRG